MHNGVPPSASPPSSLYPYVRSLTSVVFFGRNAPKLEEIFLMKNKSGERYKLWEKIVSKWYKIGRALGIANDLLESIRVDGSDTESKLISVLAKWFDNAGNLPHSDEYPLTWRGLKTLLEDIENGEVAKEFFEFLRNMS